MSSLYSPFGPLFRHSAASYVVQPWGGSSQRHHETPFSGARDCYDRNALMEENNLMSRLCCRRKYLSAKSSERKNDGEQMKLSCLASTRGIYSALICIRIAQTGLGACDSSPGRSTGSMHRPRQYRTNSKYFVLHECNAVVVGDSPMNRRPP